MKTKQINIILAAIVGIIVLAFFGFILLSQSDKGAVKNIDLTKTTKINALTAPKAENKNQNLAINSSAAVQQIAPDKVILAVPYINETPDDNWTGPWKNACEEASIAMAQNYYLGKISVSIADQKSFMQTLFDLEDKIWGSNANTDAARTSQLINDHTILNSKIVEQPTIEQIKSELQQKRPVITPLYGFDLHNKNIPFVPAPRGTSYHMLVVIGYDDTTGEFITNDTGDRIAGPAHRYKYELFMNAIHDYSFVTKHADGPARAIFTYPKLVKVANNSQVYFLQGDVKQLVSNQSVFQAKGWTVDMVNVVEQAWLATFTLGADIK